jgi:hypothetical protein
MWDALGQQLLYGSGMDLTLVVKFQWLTHTNLRSGISIKLAYQDWKIKRISSR